MEKQSSLETSVEEPVLADVRLRHRIELNKFTLISPRNNSKQTVIPRLLYLHIFSVFTFKHDNDS